MHVESALCVGVTIVMHTYAHKFTVAANTWVHEKCCQVDHQ